MQSTPNLKCVSTCKLAENLSNVNLCTSKERGLIHYPIFFLYKSINVVSSIGLMIINCVIVEKRVVKKVVNLLFFISFRSLKEQKGQQKEYELKSFVAFFLGSWSRKGVQCWRHWACV